MAKKSKTNQPKINYPIGKQAAKQQAEKEPDFYHKHKSYDMDSNRSGCAHIFLYS